MSNTHILTMHSSELDMLLRNHEFFTDAEIRLAAKRKVALDKKSFTAKLAERSWAQHQQEMMSNYYTSNSYYRSIAAAQNINSGFNNGVLGNLLG